MPPSAAAALGLALFGILVAVVGGMAARVPIKTGIRYRGESAATGQYPIAAKYTGSAASLFLREEE